MRFILRSIFLVSLFLVTLFNQNIMCAHDKDIYSVDFEGYHGNYPVIYPKGTNAVKIVFINTVDAYPLNNAAAKFLASHIKDSGVDSSNLVLLSPGDKANQFSTLLFQHLGCSDLVIVRATDKAGSVLSADYSSITSPGTKMLHLTQEQLDRIKGKKVLLCDDVLSTGGTLKALTDIARQAEVTEILGYAVMATEGAERDDFMERPLFKATHLPVFPQDQDIISN